MAPLPTSLSPHICVLASPDLEDLLASSSLPPLPDILQSFSPLPQVTTRTSALASVSHPSFALRFSNLVEIEAACREPEETRAMRTVDWISARITHRCGKWVDDMERAEAAEKDKPNAQTRAIVRTPWWDEVRRCTEGDCLPSKVDCWNHPAAIILAASTTAPNPLAAITALHSRPLDLPPWVDPVRLRYTVIIHPPNSPLSDEEAGALFNAVKKQYGLHTFLLPLSLPSPPPPPVQVPHILPRLPPPPTASRPTSPGHAEATPLHSPAPSSPAPDSLFQPSQANGLRMGEQDIAAIAKFVREFVTMSLVPWMEKCVVDWNENYTASRRLPSRLFSSTRRLFGTSYSPSSTTSPLPGSPRASHSSTGSQSSIMSGSTGVAGTEPHMQQRRLAEFSTILGDVKLAVGIWETLRKDGKGGSEILPLLLAPGPNVQLYASYAIASLHPLMSAGASDLPPQIFLRALTYAVRWESGIAPQDFLGDELDGDRWLVWAAGNAEEAPSALLLSHAALLSVRKRAFRRASLWYFMAANRLEKCGIKPLTMYFLRKAGELYKMRPQKNLSPTFWDADEKSSDDWDGFEAIGPGLGHALGRLLYTTGNIEQAIRLFVRLLQRRQRPMTSSRPAMIMDGVLVAEPSQDSADKLFVTDFRTAFQHFLSTSGDQENLQDLKLPCTFCLPGESSVRLSRDSAFQDGTTWKAREDSWRSFWKSEGKETLKSGGKAAVGETFWFDLAVENPLDVEITLSNITVLARDATSPDPVMNFLDIGAVEEIALDPGERRVVPIPITSRQPSSLVISAACYDFLALLPCQEELKSRGPRLHATPLQRQAKTYGPDVFIQVEVEEAEQRVSVEFVDDDRLSLAHGECSRLDVWLSNVGKSPIGELWVVAGPKDVVWADLNLPDASGSRQQEVFRSSNSLSPCKPMRIPLESISQEAALVTGRDARLTLRMHASRVEDETLSLLFVYREAQGETFSSTRATRHYEVSPILEVSATCIPARDKAHPFSLHVEATNVTNGNDVSLAQVTTMSPTWRCSAIFDSCIGTMMPAQTTRLSFAVEPWNDGQGAVETTTFVAQKLRGVLQGSLTEDSAPPSIDILCDHVAQNGVTRHSMAESALQTFIHGSRRDTMASYLSAAHPYIPVASHCRIFPLYNPAAIDVLLFWEMPAQRRSGHILMTGLNVGVGHAALRDIVSATEDAKVKRSMYAETQTEKVAILETIRTSEWNVEMNPIVVAVHDGEENAHDFVKGSCQTSASLTLRNYSRTHTSRYTLKLNNDDASVVPGALLPPSWSGRKIYRGELAPMQAATIHPQLRAVRPGTYSLSGWTVETEVGELQDAANVPWHTRHRYVQTASPTDRACITIRQAEI